jgi:ABC-type transport system involved in multi-copper enzyme maturation permease subunit
MIFLPIVSRELRVAARRGSTYWLRAGAVSVVVALGFWLVVIMREEPPRQMAMALFYVLSGSAVFYSLLSGVKSTADCLSEEKREGTLGLLFLTDLKGYDVVLGKLVANSLNSFYSVVAVLPLMAIPLLLGGVAPGEFARMALVAVNALFFSLAIGMCVSSICRSGQRSMILTLVVLVSVAALLPWIGTLLALAGKTKSISPAFLLPSPGFTFYLALDSTFNAGPQSFWNFWISLLATHGLAWVALALASVIAPRTWQDKPAGAKAVRWRERWQLWSYGDSGERAEFRRRLLDRNAYYWLAARARLKPACVWAFLGLIACVWAWGLARHGRDWINASMCLTTALALNFTLRCWLAAEATRQIAEDRKGGTLELLLSTPLAVREILRGQMLALRRQFFWPAVVVLGVEFLFMLASAADEFVPESRGRWYSLYVCGMLMLVADMVALYWIGLWQGLRQKTQTRAFSASLARVLVCPWIAYALLLLLLVLFSVQASNSPDPAWAFFLGSWFVLGVGFDIGFAAFARHKLLTDFRLVAERRYTSRAAFLSSLWHRSPRPPATAGGASHDVSAHRGT